MENHNQKLTKEMKQKLKDIQFNSVNHFVRLIAPDDIPGYRPDYSHLGKTK